ncbi:UBX [Ostreococcus tauri]|uniref:UBX n=1 Tax=Ostreococcus tauri TaxID=70448 RepID=Q01AD1_OSTTA|nr:UBX [Ostreococcus tauri]OUS49633.1 hypothetical protein BE221DRAFT_65440 [Ostreococcus tauri]CAL51867.1 UBX [Ostreococcus tauri]|eukprot:XP_003078987.1 UBX [Ostreococcus tauri]
MDLEAAATAHFEGTLERRVETFERERSNAAADVGDDAMVISDGEGGGCGGRGESGSGGWRARDDDSEEEWRESGDESPIDLIGEDDEDPDEVNARMMREILAARERRERRSTRARIGLGMSAFEARDGGADARGGDADAMVDLPDGIDREEARMLEAAMLGIAYVPPANRVVDYGYSAPAPDHVLDARNITSETDLAYQESLRADQEKEAVRRAEEVAREMMEAEKAEAEARAKAEREAEEAARAKLASEAADALPDEPSAEAADAVNIAFRLPDGSRVMRRFSSSHNVRTLFSFIDGYEKLHDESSRLAVEPGTYRFIAQHPRRVIEAANDSTIEQVGLTHKQEALMVDLL